MILQNNCNTRGRYSIYQTLNFLMHLINNETYMKYYNMKNIPKSAVYSIISDINNVEKFYHMYKIAGKRCTYVKLDKIHR